MRRIHVLCQVYHPDTTSTSQLFTPLLETLAARGWEITVFSGFPAQAPAETPLARREHRNGVTIIRCGMRLPLKASLMSRAVAYASFLVEVFVRLVFATKADLNFGVSNPPFNAIVLWWLRRLKGTPYLYMLLDVHPEGLVALGSLRQDQWVVRVWRWHNARAYAAAECLIVLGRDMVDILQRDYHIAPTRCVYLPHWSAVAVQVPMAADASRFLKEWGLTDKFIVQYSGNMGLWHDIECFVRAASLLREYPHIHFVFIGGGIRRAKAEALSEELGLSNVSWRDFVPLADLAESLSACHVALLSLGEGLEGVAVPSKLYGILASGRAVLAQVPARSEVAITIADYDCGVVVANGDAEALAQSVLALSLDRERAARMGRNAAACYASHYTIDSAVERTHRVWSQALSGDQFANVTDVHPSNSLRNGL